MGVANRAAAVRATRHERRKLRNDDFQRRADFRHGRQRRAEGRQLRLLLVARLPPGVVRRRASTETRGTVASYAVSPAAVRLFGDAECFQNFFRDRLDNLAAGLQTDGFESTPYEDTVWLSQSREILENSGISCSSTGKGPKIGRVANRLRVLFFHIV